MVALSKLFDAPQLKLSDRIVCIKTGEQFPLTQGSLVARQYDDRLFSATGFLMNVNTQHAHQFAYRNDELSERCSSDIRQYAYAQIDDIAYAGFEALIRTQQPLGHRLDYAVHVVALLHESRLYANEHYYTGNL